MKKYCWGFLVLFCFGIVSSAEYSSNQNEDVFSIDDENIIFYDDCEDAPLQSDWNFGTNSAETVSSDEESFVGTKSYKMHQYPPYERSQMSLKALKINYDTEYWIGFAFYIPENWTNPSGWGSDIVDFHRSPDGGYDDSCDVTPSGQPFTFYTEGSDENPYFEPLIWCDSNFCSAGWGAREDAFCGWGSIVSPAWKVGGWNTMVIRVKFNYDKKGINEAWLNGEKFLSNVNQYCNSYNDEVPPYFKIGPYSSAGNDVTIYVDEIRVGNAQSSYDQVVPRADCSSEWNCSWTSWSGCINNTDTRKYICADINGCSDDNVSDSETRICENQTVNDSYGISKTYILPNVDGYLTEYGNAEKIIINGDLGAIGDYRLMWDEEALYISANVLDSKLYTQYSNDDENLWEDDSVEIMFDTQNDKGVHMDNNDYKFIINLNNARLDARNFDSSWDTQFESRVVVNGTINNNNDSDVGYKIEVKIPWWDDFNLQNTWGMNIKLNDRIENDNTGTQWSTRGENVNVPNGWNEVFFKIGFHDADLDENGNVSFGELFAYVELWERGEISLNDFLSGVLVWKNF